MRTCVWLLAGVGASVDGKSTTLDEASAAASNTTCVRTFVRVNSIMSLKIRLSFEALHDVLAEMISSRVSGVPCYRDTSRRGKGEKKEHY